MNNLKADLLKLIDPSVNLTLEETKQLLKSKTIKNNEQSRKRHQIAFSRI